MVVINEDRRRDVGGSRHDYIRRMIISLYFIEDVTRHTWQCPYRWSFVHFREGGQKGWKDTKISLEPTAGFFHQASTREFGKGICRERTSGKWRPVQPRVSLFLIEAKLTISSGYAGKRLYPSTMTRRGMPRPRHVNYPLRRDETFRVLRLRGVRRAADNCAVAS